MAEKSEVKTKKKLIIADAILDLGFVDKLPPNRKVELYPGIIAKFKVAKKAAEALVVESKFKVAQDTLETKK